LRIEIASMESTYNEMSARWTDKNPKMAKFRERLDGKREELKAGIQEVRDRNIEAWKGKIEPKEAEIKTIEAELATLESDRKLIQSEIDEESKRVKTVESRLPLVRNELGALEEKEKQSKADLEAMGKILAEKRAKLGAAPLPQSLVVYQRAATAERKGTYGGVVGGAGGAVAGYLCAVALLLLRLNLRRSFIDTKDVETELGRPVLARFPKRG
jgi:septal ring factor EnvC (AmiA/AmiB activator)